MTVHATSPPIAVARAANPGGNRSSLARLAEVVPEAPTALARDTDRRLRHQHSLLPRHRHRLGLAARIEQVLVVAYALIRAREPGSPQQLMRLVRLDALVELIDELVGEIELC